MQVDAEQLYGLACIVKAGMTDPAVDVSAPKEEPRRKKPKQNSVPYPDFNKSLVTQMRRSPNRAGAARGAQTGIVGATLGALIARLMSNKPSHVAGGALAGGVVGAIPGFHSGKSEAKSDYSRLLFLRRRMGINEPGELEAMLRHPELAQKFIKSES